LYVEGFFGFYKQTFSRENYQKTPNKFVNYILTPNKIKNFRLTSSWILFKINAKLIRLYTLPYYCYFLMASCQSILSLSYYLLVFLMS
jgi:hypothetical protein